MERDMFRAKLDELIDAAKTTSDPVIMKCGVVLLGLRGSMYGGDDYFEAFVDNVMSLIKRQRDSLAEG